MRKAKKPGDALRQRYEMVMGAINESVYEWDLSRDRFWTSESMQRLLGLSPDRLTLERWRKSIHPDDYARFRDATVAHLKGETERFECDYRFRSGDGTWHWARTHGLAVRDRAGRALRMVGSTGDITELKRTEQAQTATAEILRVISGSPTDVQPVFEAILTHASRLCEASFAAVFTFDGELLRNVAYLNASLEFARFLGSGGVRPSRETTTRRCALERRTIHTADLMNDPEFSPPEAQRREKVRTSLSVPMFREGALVGVITLWRAEVRPFTGKQIALVETFAAQAVIAIENVRHFNETREALEEQKAIAEVLGVVTQLQTDVQPVFQAIGRNAARLCGALFSCVYRFDGELVHLVATHNLPPEAREVGRTLYPMRPDRSQLSGRAVLTRSVQRLEDATQDPEYALHVAVAGGWRRLLAVPMLREGEPLGVIAVGWRDPGPIPESRVELLKTFADQAVIAIEKVRLFNEIREKGRQLEAANRHKSQFLANMSHELRTPLNAIIGFARIVARHSQGRLEPRQFDNLEKIQASGQHLLALINAILDLSKVEAGRVEVQPSEVALASVLEQCLRIIEPLVRVSLVREFNGALPSMYVDEEKLRQIVLNLLSNAAKFTERGTIRLKAQAADGAVAIAVADTGMGIPGDKLGLIFQEFEQADASIKRSHGGTGLGLAIAQRLARLMGGDIGVESTLGSGSTFTLTLPLRYSA
jgi:PAS domain S-box-containing protein